MTTLEQLQKVLNKNKDKRITVLGTTCIGKTTLLKDIPQGVAISDIAPPLTEEEADFYYNAPLTRENNRKMVAMRADRTFIDPGKPAFGTAIAKNTELIVYLVIDDNLLAKRAKMRNVLFERAKTMQKFIEEQIEESKLPVIEVTVKE